jgi:hypothetical protein
MLDFDYFLPDGGRAFLWTVGGRDSLEDGSL